MGEHEGTVQFEYDDKSKKTKLILTRFGLTIGTLRFHEKSLFIRLLAFVPFWNYKPTNAYHADNPGVYTSERICFEYYNKSVLNTTTFYLECVNHKEVKFKGETLTFTLHFFEN